MCFENRLKDANRESRRELLGQIGSPETIRQTDKIYAATHRFLQKEGPWRGAYRIDRIWGDVPVALKRTLTGEGPAIVLDIAEDLAADIPARVELRLSPEQAQGTAEVQLRARYQPCEERICYRPRTVPLTVRFQVRAAPP